MKTRTRPSAGSARQARGSTGSPRPEPAEGQANETADGDTKRTFSCPRSFLRYAHNRPPKSEVNPNGSYLNNFEGCFTVQTGGGGQSYYTVHPSGGPYDSLFKVMHGQKEEFTGFGQWWSYPPFGTRYHDRDSFPDEVALPPDP